MMDELARVRGQSLYACVFFALCIVIVKTKYFMCHKVLCFKLSKFHCTWKFNSSMDILSIIQPLPGQHDSLQT